MTGPLEGLPRFPELEPLSLEHLPIIRAMVARFPSYSDFTPMSLWAWDATCGFRLAQCRENLVIEFNDYIEPERRSLSYLGETEVVATALELLEAAATAPGLTAELRLVPACVADLLASDPLLFVEEEEESQDYLYEPARYVELAGPAFRHLREKLHRYERAVAAEGPVWVSEIAPEMLSKRSEEVLAVFDSWAAGGTDGVALSRDEGFATARLLETLPAMSEVARFHCVVAESRMGLHGYVINELLDGARAVGHFLKSDGRFADMTSQLFVSAARALAERDIVELNAEQDLGILGLRQYKRRLRPVGALKKYVVRLSG